MRITDRTAPGWTQWFPRVQNLAGDAFLITLGNVVYYACQWGFVLVLAKLGTQEQVGEYALGMAVTAPVVMIAQLQLRTVFMADVSEAHPFRDYFRFRLICLAGAQGLVAAIVLLAHWSWHVRLVVVLVSLAQGIESVGEICHGAMVKYGHSKRMAISLMMKGPVALGLLILGMVLTSNVAFAVAGLAIGRLVVLLSYEISRKPIPQVTDPQAPFAWRSFLILGQTSLALGIAGALASFSSNLPRYFIEHVLGERDLGAFAAIASLLGVGNLVMASVSLALFTRFARLHVARETAQFKTLLLGYLAVVATLGILLVSVCASFGATILRLVLRPQYQQYSHLLVWMTAAASVGYIAAALSGILASLKCFVPQAYLMAAATAVTFLSCWLLIPRYGLFGATWATMAFMGFQATGAAALLLRWQNRSVPYCAPSGRFAGEILS